MGLKPDTKGILAASLEELLEKHDYEEITVDAITKNCGAARATFYRHFKDKQDLMQWTYISQAEKVEEIFASPAQWDRAVAQGLDLVQKKRAFLRAALEYKRQNPFMDFWYQNSLAYLQSLLARGLGPGGVPQTLSAAAKLYCYGIIGLLVEWINDDCRTPAAAVAQGIIASVPLPLSPSLHGGQAEP